MAITLGTGPTIRAVLFDLDGTLYDQARLRTLMALELLTLPLSAPTRALQRWRALSAYRRAQEELRRERQGAGHAVARAQVMKAARTSGMAEADVRRLVDDWMGRRPLKYLRWCRAAGIDELLSDLKARGVPTGILSDYPAQAKLEALGLGDRFAPVLCSTDDDIQALKPDPRGFLRAAETWRVDPAEVLVVGDRVEVDAAGAAAAGMACVIIQRGPASGDQHPPYMALPSFERLRRVLADSR